MFRHAAAFKDRSEVWSGPDLTFSSCQCSLGMSIDRLCLFLCVIAGTSCSDASKRPNLDLGPRKNNTQMA